jgi:hypothetical protein
MTIAGFFSRPSFSHFPYIINITTRFLYMMTEFFNCSSFIISAEADFSGSSEEPPTG